MWYVLSYLGVLKDLPKRSLNINLHKKMFIFKNKLIKKTSVFLRQKILPFPVQIFKINWLQKGTKNVVHIRFMFATILCWSNLHSHNTNVAYLTVIKTLTSLVVWAENRNYLLPNAKLMHYVLRFDCGYKTHISYYFAKKHQLMHITRERLDIIF